MRTALAYLLIGVGFALVAGLALALQSLFAPWLSYVLPMPLMMIIFPVFWAGLYTYYAVPWWGAIANVPVPDWMSRTQDTIQKGLAYGGAILPAAIGIYWFTLLDLVYLSGQVALAGLAALIAAYLLYIAPRIWSRIADRMIPNRIFRVQRAVWMLIVYLAIAAIVLFALGTLLELF